MTMSSVRTFTIPSTTGRSIQATTEMVPWSGDYCSLTRIRLPHLWMQRFSDNLPHRPAKLAPGAHSFVPTKPKSMQMWDGRETAGIGLPVGMRGIGAPSGDAEWATMSLPVEDYMIAASTITGKDMSIPADGLILQPSAAALLRHKNYAKRQPVSLPERSLRSPDAAHSLEQELIRPDESTARRRASFRKQLLAAPASLRSCGSSWQWAGRDGEQSIVHSRSARRSASLAVLCDNLVTRGRPQRYLWQRRMNMTRHHLTRS